jgi:hypothetical protein
MARVLSCATEGATGNREDLLKPVKNQLLENGTGAA